MFWGVTKDQNENRTDYRLDSFILNKKKNLKSKGNSELQNTICNKHGRVNNLTLSDFMSY